MSWNKISFLQDQRRQKAFTFQELSGSLIPLGWQAQTLDEEGLGDRLRTHLVLETDENT